MEDVVLTTNLTDVPLFKRGKVRDVYDLGENLLIVATDRISAFDVILPNGIPNKGKVLTKISVFWFEKVKHIVENHIVATEIEDFPSVLKKYSDILKDRSMLVKKAKPVPIECIVRGYLSGSAWQDYKKNKSICGISLPEGLRESDKLPEAIFTPSTKAEEGHDINITFEEAKSIAGSDIAEAVKIKSLEVYKEASLLAEKKGIIIADTKMEFGLLDGKLILIDELLTPDSSRFWSKAEYIPGKPQDSFDKQIVRDYLLSTNWDKTPPGPKLPKEIVEKTSKRYEEILNILTN